MAPILSQFVILDLHDKKQPVYLVGYDPASGGGPGGSPQATRQNNYQVVFDRIWRSATASRSAIRSS